MKAKRVFAALFVAVLIISLSLSLFACDDPSGLDPLNPNVTPTEDNFATIYSAFLNTSNISFDLDIKDSTTTTNLAVDPNQTRESSSVVNYRCSLCSNTFMRIDKNSTRSLFFTFNPANFDQSTLLSVFVTFA